MKKQQLLTELLGTEEAERLAEAELAELFGVHRVTRSIFAVRDTRGRYGHPKLMAARELYAMAMKERLAEAPVFTNPGLVKDFLVARLSGLDSEIFAALWLTPKHSLIEFDELAVGTIDQALVHPREVVKRALEQSASAVVFCHNHPSGNENPSQSDLAMTNTLKASLAAIDVRVLDHVIVAGNQTTSMAERGLL